MTKRWLLFVCAAAVLGLVGTAPALAAQPYPLNYKTFDLASGSSSGTVFSGGSLTLGSSGLGSLSYLDPFANYSGDGVDGSGDYVSGTWTSGVTNLSFGFNELVSSWNANTPAGTWVQVEVQPQIDDGHWAKWYILGRWSSDDYSFHRTSVGGQGDADGFVSIDTFFTKDHPAIAYRLRATLYRREHRLVRPDAQPPERDRVEPDQPEGQLPEHDDDERPHRGRPRRPAVLAGDPPRRLPAVRQRRRGLVQPDLDLDGRRLLDADSRPQLQPDAGRVLVGDRGAASPPTRIRGSTTPPATSSTTTTTAPATGRSTRPTPPRAGSSPT